MIQELPRNTVATLVTGVALFWLVDVLVGERRRRSRTAGVILLAACILLVSVPFAGGLSLTGFVSSILPGFSIPFSAWMVQRVACRLGYPTLLRDHDQFLLWTFGTAAGVLLYPAALGLTHTDPYSAGWAGGVLYPVVGLLGALLIGLKIRFGWILIIAIATWHLGGLESSNYWDYLVDPIYFLISLPLTLMAWTRRPPRGLLPARQ